MGAFAEIQCGGKTNGVTSGGGSCDRIDLFANVWVCTCLVFSDACCAEEKGHLAV